VNGSDDFIERDYSPDGALLAEFLVQTQLMSHETRTPRLTDTATGEVLLSLDDSLFDASVSWLGPRQVRLHLRHYAMDGSLHVELDAERKVWSIPEQQTGDLPLATISKELPKRFRRAAQAVPKAQPLARPKNRTDGLLTLAVIALVVAAIAFGVWYCTAVPRQQLTPLPVFPGNR
jgi:hypothetical protein